MDNRQKFFAYLNRMKYIERWSLMRSSVKENIMEHSESVAVIAHALAVINNEIFKGSADAAKTALMAVYHEAGEVITGDLPTPIKYFNPRIKTAYKELEEYAADKLMNSMPEAFRPRYSEYLQPDMESIEYKLMKAADKLAAYIKCIEENAFGNNKEFKKAKSAIKKELDAMDCKEAGYFLQEFIPAYELSLDELE